MAVTLTMLMNTIWRPNMTCTAKLTVIFYYFSSIDPPGPWKVDTGYRNPEFGPKIHAK